MEPMSSDIAKRYAASVFAVRQRGGLCTLLRRANSKRLSPCFFFPRNGRGSGQ